LRDVTQLPQQHIAWSRTRSIRALLAEIANVPLVNTLGWKMEYGAVIAAAAFNQVQVYLIRSG